MQVETGTSRDTGMTAATSPFETDSDLQRLERAILRHETLLVAFSGGVDSALLAVVAHRLLGDAMIAVTADSSSLPRRELEGAREICRRRSIPHLVVETTELDRPEYQRNGRDRCYFCKQTLFLECERTAKERKIGVVAYGYTADDAFELRPGHRAAVELGVVAPLHEANLGKAAIRKVAADLGLEVWDKPAAPCLSSRIPFGSAVTRQKLAIVESSKSCFIVSGSESAGLDSTAG